MIGNMNPLVAAQFIDHMDDKYENDPLYDNKAVEMEMKVLESAPPIPMKTCATNVQTAFVLGIVLAVLSLIGCGNGSNGIIKGIIDVIIHCILIFGAHTRNSTAILVWMVLAILSCIGYVILVVLGVIAIADAGAAAAGVVVFIVFMVGISLFQIWTIIVAKNARKEIEAGQ